MTNREIDESIAKMEKLREELVQSKEKSTKFLIDTGILNPDGTLNERYANLPALLSINRELDAPGGK